MNYYTPGDLYRAGLAGHVFQGFLHAFGSILDGLLGLSDHLVGLSFVTKLVIADQRGGGFLDSAFYFVSLATHDTNSHS